MRSSNLKDAKHSGALKKGKFLFVMWLQKKKKNNIHSAVVWAFKQ